MPAARTAVLVAHADGRDEILSFDEHRRRLRRASRTAWRRTASSRATASPSCSSRRCPSTPPVRRDEGGRDRVPLFTLFGPDGLRLRVDDCTPRLLMTNAEKAPQSHRPGRRARRRRRRRAARRARRAFPPQLHAGDPRRRPGGLPVHLRHHARTARGGQAHAPRPRHADVRRALRHRHPARRRLLLPVVAGLGPRPVARHAGAAGAGRHHRHLRRPLRRRAADEGAAGLPHHQPVGRRHALPDDAATRAPRRDYRFVAREAVLHRRADRQRDRRLRRADLRPCPPAACTAPPRSAWCWSTTPARRTSSSSRARWASRCPGGTRRGAGRPTARPARPA